MCAASGSALGSAVAVADHTGVLVAWTAFSVDEIWLIVSIGALGGFAGVLPAIEGSLTEVADNLGPVS